MIERIANLVTLAVVVIVFFLQGLAYLIPWRTMDRLRLCLLTVAFTWTALFSVSFTEVAGWIHMPLPGWYTWTIRLLLIVSGAGVVIELVRAGAFRHPQK